MRRYGREAASRKEYGRAVKQQPEHLRRPCLPIVARARIESVPNETAGRPDCERRSRVGSDVVTQALTARRRRIGGVTLLVLVAALAPSAARAQTPSVPLSAGLGLEIESHTSLEALRAAAGIGDFNGDGLDDVLIRDEPFMAERWGGRVVLGRRGPRGRRETTRGRRPVAIS